MREEHPLVLHNAIRSETDAIHTRPASDWILSCQANQTTEVGYTYAGLWSCPSNPVTADMQTGGMLPTWAA